MAELHSSNLLSTLVKRTSSENLEKARVKMNLATRISEEIKKQDLNQKEFAKIMKKSPSEISKWLSGTQNFTTDTLVDICTSLKIDIKDLFEERGTKTIAAYTIVLHSPAQKVFEPNCPYYSYVKSPGTEIKLLASTYQGLTFDIKHQQ